MRHISVIVSVLVDEIGAREHGEYHTLARSVGEKQGVNSRRHRNWYGMASRRMLKPIRAATSLKDPQSPTLTPLGV